MNINFQIDLLFNNADSWGREYDSLMWTQHRTRMKFRRYPLHLLAQKGNTDCP